MIIKNITLSRFKRFENKHIEFAPGINLIWGPNESGKSTLYDGISCALFGRERGQVVENWNSGPTAVTLTYEYDSALFQIERNFTEGVMRYSSLSDCQLTNTITDKDDIAAIIGEHLGISSKTVLDNTIFIRQAEISRPAASDLSTVGDEIQRIITGTANTSATEAVKKLESARDGVKGKARPTNPREYDKISQRLTVIAEELANAKRSREQITRLDNELAELEVRVERDSTRQESLQSLLDRHKRWSELVKRTAELDQRHKEVYSTVKSLKETLGHLEKVQAELQGYVPLVGKDDEIADNLTKSTTRINDLEVKIAEIESSGEGSRSPAGGLGSILLATAAIITGLAAVATGVYLDKRFLLLLIVTGIITILIIKRNQKAAGRISIARHIADMKASTQNELSQSVTEQHGILNYLGSPDVDRAWVKIKTYRSLTSKANDLEIEYRTLLAGKKQSEWETLEDELGRELNTSRRELEDEFAGYSPSTEESEQWRSENAALMNTLPPAIARKHEVTGALESERGNIRDIAALEGEIEYLHNRRNELEFLYKAYEEAISSLNHVTKVVSSEYLPLLSEKASEKMADATGGRYTAVKISPSWEVNADSIERNSLLPSVLSMGTMDQLYFALRLGCGDLLSGDRHLPLVLDDPFASFDCERLMNALNMLVNIAKTNQVLLMTHDPQIRDWAESNPAICPVVYL
ncbi:MAG: ATP-binding protein [Armatimonadota bacterium]